MVSNRFTVRQVTAIQMLDVAEARQKAWQQCAESAVALAAVDLPAPDPRAEARDLVRALPARIRTVWKRLHWENSRKEVWWRLIQNGVVGAGGHGWAPKKGAGCVCGWLPAQAAPSRVRALQLREHVFWGCAGAREVRRVLQRQLPQGVELLPKHVWLLEPPATELHPLVWAAVCLAALTVMLSVSKQLRRCSDLSHAPGVVDRVPALMLEALKDFAACQGPQSSVGEIGSGHPFLRARPGGGLECVLL